MGRLKEYFDDQDAKSYLNNLLITEDSSNIREAVLYLLSNTEQKFEENKKNYSESKTKLNDMIENYEKLKDYLEKELNNKYETKMQNWFEKVKKENQEMWDESLKNAKSDFKNIGNNVFIFYFNFHFNN